MSQAKANRLADTAVRRLRAAERVKRQEDALFAASLLVLREAFELRKPDAIDRALQLHEKYGASAAWLCLSALQNPVALEKAQEAQARADAIADLAHEYRNANLLAERGRHGPTPEAALRPGRDNALLALVKAGHISLAEECAANEIAEILEAITAAQHARVRNALQGGGGGKVSDFIPVFLAEWHSFRYLPWCGAMLSDVAPDMNPATKPPAGRVRRHQDLELVLTVVRDGISLDTARRSLRMGWPTALRFLKNGLQLYNRIAEMQDEGYDLPKLERYRKMLTQRDVGRFRYREVIRSGNMSRN